MGRSRRPRPERLAEKLLQVRVALGLSQSQLHRHLATPKVILHAAHISEYETGKREPPLAILLGYARAAGVPLELFIDDERELPRHLPLATSVWVMKNGRLSKKKEPS